MICGTMPKRGKDKKAPRWNPAAARRQRMFFAMRERGGAYLKEFPTTCRGKERTHESPPPGFLRAKGGRFSERYSLMKKALRRLSVKNDIPIQVVDYTCGANMLVVLEKLYRRTYITELCMSSAACSGNPQCTDNVHPHLSGAADQPRMM